jgi:hypothetical protein
MVAFRFSRRSGSRASIYPDIRRFCVLPASTEVSWVILCPLAQPNKAIGLESHIGSWLACYLEPTVLLAKLHEPRASSHHRNMKPRRYNPQLAGSRSRNMRLAHSLGGSSDSGLDARRTASPHWGARESFSLDIPSHRMSGLPTIRLGVRSSHQLACFQPDLNIRVVRSPRESYMNLP